MNNRVSDPMALMRYIDDEMSSSERESFELEMARNESLRRAVEASVGLSNGLNSMSSPHFATVEQMSGEVWASLENMLQEERSQTRGSADSVISIDSARVRKHNYLLWASGLAAAAAILFFVTRINFSETPMGQGTADVALEDSVPNQDPERQPGRDRVVVVGKSRLLRVFSSTGALAVTSVEYDQMGVSAGDRVLTLNDQAVRSEEQMRALIDALRDGELLRVRLQRNGRVVRFDYRVSAR